MTPRLIERWLPIAELGIESLRERTPMTHFPAPNRLHVWWARRPLVASRADRRAPRAGHYKKRVVTRTKTGKVAACGGRLAELLNRGAITPAE